MSEKGYMEFVYDKFVFRVREDYLYHQEECWVKQEEDGLITVGITDYLQMTGGMVMVAEINEAGSEVEEGGELGTLEAKKPTKKAKTIVGLTSPVSGVIKEVNENMEEDPVQINRDPYGEGWVCKIEPTNWIEEKQKLMDAKTYFPQMDKNVKMVMEKFKEAGTEIEFY